MNPAELISLFVLVILIENQILEKAFGCMRFPRLTRGRRAFAETGLMMLALTLPAAVLAWLLGTLLPDSAAVLGRGLALILLPAAVGAWGIRLMRGASAMEKARQSRMPGYRLTVCAVNGVLLGLAQLAMPQLYSRGLAAALLAVLLMSAALVAVGVVYESLRQRQSLCECPARLRGLPMELITAALLVMAVWGLA